MKKPRKQVDRFTVILISAIFCLVAIPSARSAEPSYNGKTLSEWLLILKRGYSYQETQAGAPSPKEAIQHIGTNGIPTLLDILDVKKGNKRKVLSELKSKALQQEFRSKDSDLEDLRSLAVDGFGILGTNAECAVPQLTKIFQDPETIFQATRALIRVGPKGFAVVTNALKDPDEGVRNTLIWVVGEEGGGDPKVVTQILIDALKDPYFANRGNAAGFLKGKDADLAIPALIPLLDEYKDDYYTIKGVTEALGSYGPAAKSAAPKLLSIFTNKVVGVDEKSTTSWGVNLMGALKAIDTDTAAKAEDFLVNSGPLNYARNGYTTTLLKNGKELIAGGSIHTEIPTVKNRDLANAELVDPATGKWTETGEMSTARYFHMAVLLPNGKVLVAGGFDGKTSAELYDPATGTWTVTGSMHSPHPSERMALQPDGKVLVYSGGWDPGIPITGHELYDPATGTWTVIPKEQERSRAWRSSMNQK